MASFVRTTFGLLATCSLAAPIAATCKLLLLDTKSNLEDEMKFEEISIQITEQEVKPDPKPIEKKKEESEETGSKDLKTKGSGNPDSGIEISGGDVNKNQEDGDQEDDEEDTDDSEEDEDSLDSQDENQDSTDPTQDSENLSGEEEQEEERKEQDSEPQAGEDQRNDSLEEQKQEESTEDSNKQMVARQPVKEIASVVEDVLKNLELLSK